jgi:hypothetical protein
LVITAGQDDEYTGAAALPDVLPMAEWLLTNQWLADWFWDCFAGKGDH